MAISHVLVLMAPDEQNETSAKLLNLAKNSVTEDSWILGPEAGLAQLDFVFQ